MGKVNAFVAELLANFEDSIHTTDNEHLEVELGGNTHEQLHVQIVVEGLKRLGSGTSSNHVHHGSLDLSEVSFTQEVPEEVKNLVACAEDLVDGVVHDQIKIALSVASVFSQDLLLSVTLGDHVHAVGEGSNLDGSDRQFTGLGSTWLAFDADDVTAAKS